MYIVSKYYYIRWLHSPEEVGNTAFVETLDDKERELLALLIADNFASQVLTDGFYHADPHSGNRFDGKMLSNFKSML